MSKEKLVPKLRFEHFKNAEYWTNFELGELANIVRGASPRPIQDPKWFDKDSTVGWLRISDVTRQNGRIYYLDQRISKAGQEKTRVLKSPHLLISIAATVGKPVINYVDTGVHDGFLIFKDPIFDKEFMYQWLEMFRLNWFRYGQPGSQINLNSNLVKNQNVYLPLLQEQEKIGKFFVKLDELIQLQQSKVNKVKDLKSAYLSEMFPKEGEKYPKKRFEGFTEPWMAKKLGSLLGYEQPTDYLVKSDSYDDSYLTPVLTAGKSFLLGYTNETEGIYKADNNNGVIIFDDFTTSSHFVDFDFKVKSSAMKFLRTNQSNLNLYFLYNLLTNINYSPESHERHWISIFSEFGVLIPTEKEQEKIGQFFKNLDNQISIEEEKLAKLEKLKQAYLNDMFV